MALDPIIAGGYRGVEIPNALQQYAQVTGIQNAMQEQRMRALQMQQLQEEGVMRNQLRALNPEAPDYATQVMRFDPKLGSELKLRATQAETARRQQEQADIQARESGLKIWQSLARDASLNPTDDALQQLASEAVRLKVAGMPEATSTLQRFLAMPMEQRSALLARTGAAAAQPEKPAQPTDLIRNYEYAKAQGFTGSLFDYERQLSAAKRPPAAPATPSAPVAVYNPATGLSEYVSREEAIGKRMTPAAQAPVLPPKEIQKREAALPQASAAVKAFAAKSQSFIKDLEMLRDDPGLDQITGMIYGRTPSISREGSRAQALFDKITAKGAFQGLQDLRDASKTGGALGNVSDAENKRLEAAFAAIDRRQNVEDVRAALNRAIDDIKLSQQRTREAYDETYSYREGRTATPAKPAKLAPRDQEALDWANANPKDPRAAQIKQRLGM